MPFSVVNISEKKKSSFKVKIYTPLRHLVRVSYLLGFLVRGVNSSSLIKELLGNSILTSCVKNENISPSWHKHVQSCKRNFCVTPEPLEVLSWNFGPWNKISLRNILKSKSNPSAASAHGQMTHFWNMVRL